jgi:hypothetical protein
LLLSSLLIATGCEKASVTPEFAAVSSQDAAPVKERGIETRVIGNLYPSGRAFEATLRINSLAYVGAQTIATASLQQIGGGLSRALAAQLESAKFKFVVGTPDNDYYVYGGGLNAPGAYENFTFSIASDGYGDGGKVLELNGPNTDKSYSLTLNATNTPKWNSVAPMVAEVVGLWHTSTEVRAVALMEDGQLAPDPATGFPVYVPGTAPSRSSGGLTAAGRVALQAKLDAITAVVGRF